MTRAGNDLLLGVSNMPGTMLEFTNILAHLNHTIIQALHAIIHSWTENDGLVGSSLHPNIQQGAGKNDVVFS